MSGARPDMRRAVFNPGPLSHGEAGQRAHLGRVEPEDDILTRDARLDQLVGDRTRRAVVLNPDLVADDVDMHDRAVDAAVPIPAHMHYLIMVPLAIFDRLGFDLAVGGLVACIFPDHSADNFAITLYSIHW